jgi:hypothetical protein
MVAVSLFAGALGAATAVLATLWLVDGTFGLMAGLVRRVRVPKSVHPDPFALPDNVVSLFGPRN